MPTVHQGSKTLWKKAFGSSLTPLSIIGRKFLFTCTNGEQLYENTVVSISGTILGVSAGDREIELFVSTPLFDNDEIRSVIYDDLYKRWGIRLTENHEFCEGDVVFE